MPDDLLKNLAEGISGPLKYTRVGSDSHFTKKRFIGLTLIRSFLSIGDVMKAKIVFLPTHLK